MKILSLTVRPFEPGDYAAVSTTPWAGDTFGPAFTAIGRNGEVAGCAGLMLSTYAPTARAWVAIGPVGRAHRLATAWAVVLGLRRLMQQYQLVRVEADSLMSDSAAHRWLTRMGFEDEGVMRKKGPNGEDMMRFALVPKETV